MPFVEHGSSVITFEECGAGQKVKYAKKAISARLCVELKEEEIWLSAFTDTMMVLLKKANLEEDAKGDDIIAALLNLENIRMKINAKSLYILKVY